MPLPPDDLPPQQRDLAKCCPCVQKRFRLLVDILDDEGIFLSTIETLRDPRRQAWYLKTGVSRTTNSKHLPQEPNGLSLAIDVCPVEYLTQKGWNSKGPHWKALGAAAKAVGLKWGGTWKGFVDKAHLQLAKCLCKEDV